MQIRHVLFAMALVSMSASGCMVDDGADLEAELGVAESAIVVDGPLYGGNGGFAFHTASSDPDDKIVSVQVRSGSEIDGLKIRYASGRVESYGGTGGHLQDQWMIFDDEVLVGISGKFGSRVDSLRFYTSTGRVSQKYGGNGGNTFFSTFVPGGSTILGFQGRDGSRIDKIGLVWDHP